MYVLQLLQGLEGRRLKSAQHRFDSLLLLKVEYLWIHRYEPTRYRRRFTVVATATKAAMNMERKCIPRWGCFSASPTAGVILVDFSVQRNINYVPLFHP